MKKTLLFCSLGAAMLVSCSDGDTGEVTGNDSTTTPVVDDDLLGGGAAPVINISYTVPYDLASNTATPAELCEFAWEEFIALNWQSSWSKDSLRDNPDTSWNLSMGNADLTVWETYAHRTELRPATGLMTDFNKVPNYTYQEQPAPLPGTTPDYTLFNNLDENNEIGSCLLYAFVDEGYNNMVLYQAKTNASEYNYVKKNYNSSADLKAATGKTSTNISTTNNYYASGVAGESCNCPDADSVFCLPCGNPSTLEQGAIEIKTAWRELHGSETAADFITRNTIVYESVGGVTHYTNRTMALIGLHIIHKTTNYPAFVFATFEHTSVMQDNMAYIGLNDSEKGDTVKNFPRYATELIPQEATDATNAAHSEISAQNSNSVLLNYVLTGVQGTPTGDTSSFSYYLANYVIESDMSLGHFSGSPKDPTMPNVLTQDPNNLRVSMGGCQGCHGLNAQRFGTDFSFIMAPNGQKEPDPDEGITAHSEAKLKAFLELSKK